MATAPARPDPSDPLDCSDSASSQSEMQRATPEVIDRKALLATLRETLAAGNQPIDAILSALADAARVLSTADGIALALPQNGSTVLAAIAARM